LCIFFFLNDTATTEIYTLSLHDALPISWPSQFVIMTYMGSTPYMSSLCVARSEEHTSELQSHLHLVCRLMLEKKRHLWMRSDRRSAKSSSSSAKLSSPLCPTRWIYCSIIPPFFF